MRTESQASCKSILFGHVNGAFTTVIGNHIGKFEFACGATLFLDGIGAWKRRYVQASGMRQSEFRADHALYRPISARV